MMNEFKIACPESTSETNGKFEAGEMAKGLRRIDWPLLLLQALEVPGAVTVANH